MYYLLLIKVTYDDVSSAVRFPSPPTPPELNFFLFFIFLVFCAITTSSQVLPGIIQLLKEFLPHDQTSCDLSHFFSGDVYH